MNKTVRWMVLLALVLGIAMLAKNRLVLADGAAREAYQSDLAFVNGFVWNDVDRDGMQDGNERGLPDVTVNLYDSAKTLVNTAITDASGRYQFDNLVPASYYIGFVPPAGYLISPKDRAGDEKLDSDADITTGETSPTELVAGENISNWDVGLYNLGLLFAKPKPGSVKPPPKSIVICADGLHSIGGVSTIHVTNLAPGYCLEVFLHNKNYALGRIPDGAGSTLANVTFLKVYYYGKFVYEVPVSDGSVEICYAIPPNKTASLYFYNHYGPRFGQGTSQPGWVPATTTGDATIACAPAQVSGAYGLIGQ